MDFKKYTNESLKTLLLYAFDIIFKRSNLKNGLLLVKKKVIEKSGDFVHKEGRLGFVAKDILKDDGNFKEFRPVGEQQNVGSEKMHCVSESACNTIETRINYYLSLIKAKKATKEQIEIVKVFDHFGFIKNGKCLISTRYVAAGSGTTVRGNDQKSVADFIHNYGLVPKDDFPYVNTWNEYYYTGDTIVKNNNRLPSELIAKGKKIAEYLNFAYEWVETQDIPDTYKYGPLQCIGACWYSEKDGIFTRNLYNANHAFQGDGQQATFQQILDSYFNFDKKVANNFYKNYAMIYTIQLEKPLSPFNPEYIKVLKDRGLEYVLLVNKYGDYDPGVYKLLDDKIEKADLKLLLDTAVTKLAKDGKLTGISVDDFKKIINIL